MPNSVFLADTLFSLPGQAAGDLFVASSATAITPLADVATGQLLASGGVGAAPAYTATPSVTSLTAAQTALGTTSTDGLIAQNSTAAAAGAQQISPRMRWRGFGWKTNATAASQSVDWFSELLPVQGAAAPTGLWRLGESIAGGAATYPLQVGSDGALTLLALVSLIPEAANTLSQYSGASAQTYNVYRARTDASNYARIRIAAGASANILEEQAGTGSTSALRIGTQSATNLILRAGGNDRWTIGPSAGDLIPEVNNASDIGSTSFAPKTIYAATSVRAPAYVVGSTAGVDFSGAVTNITVVKGIVTAAS